MTHYLAYTNAILLKIDDAHHYAKMTIKNNPEFFEGYVLLLLIYTA